MSFKIVIMNSLSFFLYLFLCMSPIVIKFLFWRKESKKWLNIILCILFLLILLSIYIFQYWGNTSFLYGRPSFFTGSSESWDRDLELDGVSSCDVVFTFFTIFSPFVIKLLLWWNKLSKWLNLVLWFLFFCIVTFYIIC